LVIEPAIQKSFFCAPGLAARRVFREVAMEDRANQRRALDQLDAGDVLMVTCLDRLGAE
jgi:DNA invertase Pin-like site-specific DNA recombinase